MANWEPYSISWKLGERKGIASLTALSIEDAKKTALLISSKVAVDTPSSYGIPFGATIKRVWKHKPQSHKQKLAQQYRSCIGALAMAEFNIGRVYASSMGVNVTNPQKEMYQRAALQNAAKKHVANAKRDVRDLFIRCGLKIK